MDTEIKKLSAEELNKMGLVFIESKHADDALKYFNKAIEADSGYLEPYYNKAMIYSVTEKYDEAIACYDEILSKAPSQGEAFYQKANVLFFYKEDIKAAVELYNKAIYLGEKNEDIYYHLGLCMEASGMNEEALKWIDRADRTNEKRTDILIKKAELLTSIKRYNEAIHCYDRVLVLESDNEEAFHFKAILLAELKKSEEALKILDEAEKVIGAKVIFEYDRALIYESQGKYKDALLCIDKGLELDSSNTMLIVKKGSLLTMAENFEGAKNVFDKVSELEPENVEGYFNKASVHILLNEHDEAYKLFEMIIQKCDNLNPYKIHSYYYKALSLKNAGKADEAKKAYETALMNYSALALTYTYDVQLMLLKANTLRDLQRFEEAEELYEYVLDLDKDMAEAHLMRGKNYFYVGKLSDAKREIDRAVSINPAYKTLVDLDSELKSVFNSCEVGKV